MITVVLRALARGKLTALAMVATLILVTASVAVANNPPMSVNSSTTNMDEFNADHQLDAANSSELLSKAIYTKQLTSTGRNLVEGDDHEGEGNGRQVAAVACDEGDIVLSGGHFKVDKGTTLVASGPSPHHNSWKLVWIDDKTEDSIGVKVLCADLGTPQTDSAPEAAVPEATTPEATSPEATTSEAISPEASASATASPEATSDPVAASPEAAAEGTTPETSSSATASPEASVPETSAPETTAPEATAPQTLPAK
jgi:hypothetical protein